MYADKTWLERKGATSKTTTDSCCQEKEERNSADEYKGLSKTEFMKERK